MRLSIIIPVYNVEQYIARCLDSCLSQDIPADEYEIIVVNDGTPDNSMAIVKNYCHKYNNIRVVNRENGGLSAARNTGLEVAQGEYVWFVDSDDRIAIHSIKDLLSYAEINNLDVLCMGLNLEYPDGRIVKRPIACEDKRRIYDGKDFIVKVGMPHSACVAFWEREFLLSSGLMFYEGITHEDFEYITRAYSLAERIGVIDTYIYYYYQREGSIMKSKNDARRCRDFMKIADSLYDFAQEKFEKGSEPYKELMRRVYFAVFQSLAYYSSDVFPLSIYKQKPYFPMNLSMDNGTLGTKIRLANNSLRLYILVRQLQKVIKRKLY